ncbi:Serine/threonine protein phosphatase [Handroanthus impetiginosus]|uniref:protein-serine/threonine phosphatase n=1 Tax=Handroanthus impetiginosus TaxID=429701 RepID=A0A2G9HGV3_9LAMI|nr:Serine/threonine protein phosphatase [Handroanthus impetiginosus]
MEKAMSYSSSILPSSAVVSVSIVILMLLLIIIIILLACKFKPWRRFLSSYATVRRRHRASIEVDDIQRPLVSGDLDIIESQSSEPTASYSFQGAGHQTHGDFSSTQSTAEAPKQRVLSTSRQLTHSDSFILDIPNPSEDSLVGRTLKRPVAANQFAEERIYEKGKDVAYSSKHGADSDTFRDFMPTYTANQRSILILEVIAGPSPGLCYSIDSTNSSKLPVTMGRVSPCDILLKDSEVSGKHATINWNANKLRWELVDMGSLNGTLLNSKAVHHNQPGSRHSGTPVNLSSGDIITLGTSSKISVQITSQRECHIPLGIGTASDPMALRRGGKKLPMEDICYYQWPLTGTEQFGLFGICDGHGGADAATSVSKIMPEVIAGILSDSFRREKVLSQCDASDVLREAFYQTEAHINHYYEGCTATVLLVWADGHENFYAQCANVGDSACVVNIEGKQIKLTEDHRITSYSERARFQASGAPLRDGETRIGGINLARMLGDKFLKEQDARFSSEPYISEVVYVPRASKGFALLASDGFWDVVSIKKAVQLVHQTMEGNISEGDNPAEKMANLLLNEARTLRTKDNTSIIFLDFNSTNSNYSCKVDP